ncbi:PAS domain S-box protein [Marinomonas transparens]|uniref:Sensory/regulatory protein RpfC n=1 Tax=Marinomonas transparens TaxID=2795388 RepID=A0A934JMP6_9GAMM|nr:PAS domain S-box protein [Marinomonas transparens]MBJ7539040.1 PAS domain S-box protein [Marinomonas transparens]
MNEFEASLKVARSLLGVSCAGLIFDDSRVVTSGSIHDFDLEKFALQLWQTSSLSSARYFDFSQLLAGLSSLSVSPKLACFIVEPVQFVGGGKASLFFVDERSYQQEEGELEQHVSSLVSMFSVLPFPGPDAKSYQNLCSERDDLLKLTDNLPLLVSVMNEELRYEFVNNSYEKRYSLPKEDIIGMYVSDLINPVAFELIEQKLKSVLAGESVQFGYPIKLGLNDEIRYLESSYIPRFSDGKVNGIFGCVQDVTSSRRTVQTLSRLHQVTADNALSLDEKLQKILLVGVEQFGLPIGLISSIKDNVYRVEYCHTPNGEVEAGATFGLEDTYCVHTLKSDTPTSYYHTALSEICDHPCYKSFGLEAYIGVVVYVDGERWGTLNFSSPNPKGQPFGDDDDELMKLLSQWVGNEITRHRWEVSLKAAERQQRLILESVHEGIIGLNSVGKITFVNPAACRMTGYDSEELLGQTLYKLFYQDKPIDGTSYAYEDCPVNTTLFSGASNHVRGESFYRKNGTTFVSEYITIPMYSEEGVVEGGVVTFQDRTEQLSAEKELKEQKQLFESLFVDAPEAIALVSVDRKIQMVNPAFCDLFGYSVDEAVGKSTQMFYADEGEFAETGLVMECLVHKHESARYRVSYRDKQGRAFQTETVSSMVRNADGGLGGYIGHIRDVTERLKVEQKMIDTNLRLSMAANAAGIGVWDWNLYDGTLHWDEWMYRIFGLVKNKDSDPYQAWEEGVGEDKAWITEGSERLKALAGKSKYEIENSDFDFADLDLDFRILRTDGQTRYLQSNAVIVYDENGRASHIVGVNMDVTARKETEAVLRAASEQAVAASQAKSNFLATMSHEIRTPLNGVLGMAELLSGSALSSEQRGQLKVLRDSGEGLLELINEILDFSKIEAGHLSIERVDFNLEKVIYDVARLLMVRAEEKGIDLLVEYDNDCPRMLVGDAFRIKQIISNLVSNAVKFTHVGQVVISTKGVTDALGGVSLHLSVSDTGVGIASHVQPYLFNAFTQADNSTTRRFGGTGLGLAITKQLVDLMSGEVSLVSEPDVGSVFSVRLNLPESYVPLEAENMIDLSSLAGQKTLVVDDNETNLTILKNQLSACDIDADTELNPEVALDRIIQAITEGQPYSIVILDYLMPDLDGLMLCRLIREVTHSSYRPTILMTSSSGQLSRDVLVEAGVNICIAKPMDCTTLKEALVATVSSSVLGYLISYAESGHGDVEEKLSSGVVRGRALVVEDMAANMAVARGLLNRLGVEVVEAENGEVGIEMWEKYRPDIIFMDLHMPVMDGISAMRHIRQAESRQVEKGNGNRVPIFALTADVLPERLVEVKQAGGDGLIPKPFNYKELSDALDKWLPLHNGADLKETRTKEANIEEVVMEDVQSVTLSEPSSSELPSLLDRQVLNELKALLRSDFPLLIDAFFADADSALNYFESLDGVESVDLNEVFARSHSLKSISQNVGAMELSKAAAKLEKESRQGDVPKLDEQLRDLIAMYHGVKRELKTLVAEL